MKDKFIGLCQRYLDKLKESKRKYDWDKNARGNQKEPTGSWRIWLIMAGRGFGKTRTGAETVRKWVSSGKFSHIALVGATEDDVRKVMIEGASGILNVHPCEERPKYEFSKGQLVWSNGVIATIYSSEAYEKLRGPQFDGAWVDEFAKFKSPAKVFDQLNFALRIGENPRMIITTTPRPIALLKEMQNNLEKYNLVLTHGSTFDNIDNLSPEFIEFMRSRYQNHSLGQQELMGKIIEDKADACWSYDLIAKNRVDSLPHLVQIVIAIDPAVTYNQDSDETGMVVCGRDKDGKAYVLADLSAKMSTQKWAQTALEAWREYRADLIIAESNNGGDLVANILRTHDANLPIKLIYASRGKLTRAQPIAYLYQQGLIKHYVPTEINHLSSLEEQMCDWTPDCSYSPDRMDALVWALTELMLNKKPQIRIWEY